MIPKNYFWQPPNPPLMADKKIPLNFFQLNPITEPPTQDDVDKVTKVFENLPAVLTPIKLSESNLSFYGNVEKRGNYYFGSVVKNQVNNIPPSFDEVSQTFAALPLGANQGLGYPASFLYDPKYRIVMIESTKNGVGISMLLGLISSNCGILIQPSLVINPSSLQEFYGMTIISKFQVKVAKIESGSIFKTKKNTSLGEIIHTTDDTNTDTLEYTLTKTKRKDSLKRGKISTLLRSLLKYDDEREVKKLIVMGKADEESGSETIDFIEHRLHDFIIVEKQRLISSFNPDEHYQKLLAVYQGHDLSVYKVQA